MIFLTSQAVTLFGSTLVQMAIVWYVTLNTGKGAWIAAFTVMSYLPQFLISFLGGVWADRYNKKALIIGADSGIAVITLAMWFVLPYIDENSLMLPLLLAMSALRSVGAGIQTPAVNAVLPQLVPEEDLMRYNGINATMQSVVQFAVLLTLFPVTAFAEENAGGVYYDGPNKICIEKDFVFTYRIDEGLTSGVSYIGIGDNHMPVSVSVSGQTYTVTGGEITTCIDSDKNHICDICGKTLSRHTGLKATCTGKAVCTYCGKEYGEIDSTNHNLEKISAQDATVTGTGNKEYWHCLYCGKYFSDGNGANKIELGDALIEKLPPEITEGKGQSLNAGEKKELTFRSNAAYSDFIRLELDGKTLDEENYAKKEGSIIVTLKADYVATLSAGEHTIGIVSESGTATTTFTVKATPAVDDGTKSPQTGDNSMMWLWVALLFVSGAGIAGATVYTKRKKAK